LHEVECAAFVEELLPDQTWWYHYYAELPVYFEPVAGATYWLSIQALYPWYEGGQWGWGECLPDDYWGAEAVNVFDALGVTEWTPYSCDDPYEHRECAFALYAEEISATEDSSWGNIKAMYR
jgi:hypothetical protein